MDEAHGIWKDKSEADFIYLNVCVGNRTIEWHMFI